MQLKNIPFSYRSCVKYLQELYPEHNISYDVHWDVMTSKNIIYKVYMAEDELIVYINASFFINKSKEMFDIYNNVKLFSNLNNAFSKDFWTYWFETYNYYMYPCLTDLNKYYQNSTIHFSSLDYKENNLNKIEDSLIKYFPKLLLFTDLYYAKFFSEKSTLSKEYFLNEKFLEASDYEIYVSGDINIYSKEQYSKPEQTITQIRKKLVDLSEICKLKFREVYCIINYGPLQLDINSSINRSFFNGGKYKGRLL